MAFFLSRSQMLLLHTLTEFDFNNTDALTELNLVEAVSILDTNRFVFLPCESTKSNFSANVL
jgi:hypothetical protein